MYEKNSFIYLGEKPLNLMKDQKRKPDKPLDKKLFNLISN